MVLSGWSNIDMHRTEALLLLPHIFLCLALPYFYFDIFWGATLPYLQFCIGIELLGHDDWLWLSVVLLSKKMLLATDCFHSICLQSWSFSAGLLARGRRLNNLWLLFFLHIITETQSTVDSVGAYEKKTSELSFEWMILDWIVFLFLGRYHRLFGFTKLTVSHIYLPMFGYGLVN